MNLKIPLDEATIARFWIKVNKDGPTPMHSPELGQGWQWMGYKPQKGGIVSLPNPNTEGNEAVICRLFFAPWSWRRAWLAWM